MRLIVRSVLVFLLLIIALFTSGCTEGSLNDSGNSGSNVIFDYSLSWSPDSSLLAYISNSRIVLRDISTGKTKQLTGTGYYDDPSWSPDSTKIAYTSATTYDTRPAIWLRSVNSSEIPKSLTSDPSAAYHPRWSKDGKLIAFNSYRKTNMDIWIKSSDATGEEKKIASNPESDQNAEWSPDGTKLVFESKRAGNSDIWLVDANGANPPIQITNESSEDTKPLWSPDGSKIAFRSDRFDIKGIWVKNSDGTGDAVHVTYGFADVSYHNWSADGKYIAFVSSNTVYAKKSDGTGDTITIGKGLEPHFSHDGKKMAYIAYENNQYNVKIIDVPTELK